jgi:hypothetical protein
MKIMSFLAVESQKSWVVLVGASEAPSVGGAEWMVESKPIT